MSRFTRRLTSVRFEDQNSLGMTVEPTEGDLNMGENNESFAEQIPVYNRDQHDGFVLGQDLVMDCSITLQMENKSLTHATQQRILDFIHRRGAFKNAVSVDDTIWCWRTIATYSDGTTTTTRTLPKCEGGEAITSGNPSNTIAVNFTNHLKPVDN